MKIIRILSLIFILSLPFYVHAQQQEQQLTVSLNPQTPAPYDKETITLTSYSFDINNSMIVWSINGKQFLKGFGEKSLSLNTRGVGESILVSIQITTPDGTLVNSSINIVPQSVDLIWESVESYTPPFYEGKALPGEGSSVRVTSIPTLSEGGKQIPANDLSYSWYLNDELVDNVSGYGRSSAVFALDYLNPQTDIKVEVRSRGGASSDKTVTIYPHDVMPLMYTYDEMLGGNYFQLLTRRLETTSDVAVLLEPFYLSTRGSLESAASYTWLLDGLPVNPEKKNILYLRPKENSMGTKPLSVMVSNSKRILQNAQTSLEVIFDTRN